jgi:serine/threonine protein kinase
MSFILGNKISSGSFGDVYKIRYNIHPEDINVSIVPTSQGGAKQNYALKVVQNAHYGIRCIAELFILLFLNYSYVMNGFQFHVDLKERMTKILMPLATCDFKSGLFKYLKSRTLPKFGSSNDKVRLTLWQIVCALGFLHSKGVVHGDVKPSNILLHHGDVKLTDFSLSSFHFNEDHKINIKESYTEQYRPPEVWKSEGYNYKGDIWALGCTFHEIIYNKKYVIDIGSKDLEFETDKDFKDLMQHMLCIDESKRFSIWDVLNHKYFRSCDKSNISFTMKYPIEKFSCIDDFVKKMMNLIEEHEDDIPKYVYEIIAMKLFLRSIDKSYYVYLNEKYIEYEAKVMHLLWEKKLGFELFK